MITLTIEETLFILFDSPKGTDREWIPISESLYKTFDHSTNIHFRELFCVDYTQDGPTITYQLWQRKYHKVSVQQALKRKEFADRQRDLRLIKTSAREVLCNKIIEQFGLARETAGQVAGLIIKQKNTEKLKMLGLNPEDEEWKELFLET